MAAGNKRCTLLVHAPWNELFVGALHPAAALFSDYMDLREANREHRNFQRLLTRCGFDVRTIRDILLEGTVDAGGKPVAGEALDELREFAAGFLEYVPGDDGVDMPQQERYKRLVISELHPFDLLDAVFFRPRVILHSTGANTGFTADYVLHPLMNLIYTRDTMLSTRKGMVIGRLHSPQRTSEQLVAEYCLHKLGVEPVFKIPEREDLYLEGGDYVSCGDLSFICHGMRTTLPAVNMLLDNDLFGTETVVVVRDSLFDQAQMHLDTYFNMVDDDLALMCESRCVATSGDPRFLTADVYVRNGGRYVLTLPGLPFVEFLGSRGIEVIPVSESDSNGFGANILRIAPREIVAVSGKSAAYRNAMRRRGVKVHWADLTHCTKGYGAVHCMTQTIGCTL